jgi:hypothetical protein
MRFDASERNLFAQLADEFVPAGEGFLSASQAGVAQDGLDQVLAVRPELAAPLKEILQSGRGKNHREWKMELQTKDPAGFGVVAEVVAAAYFLHASVREKLAYAGQTPRPINPHPDHLDDGLLEPVVKRGPIYRPTPPQTKPLK